MNESSELNFPGGGISVNIKRYQRMSSGMLEPVSDTIIFNGNIQQFKKIYKNCAIISYCTVNEEGAIDTGSIVPVGEKLPELPKSNVAGMIDGNTINGAIEQAKQPIAQPAAQPLIAQLPPVPSEKILKDGDTYIKLSGNKVFRLVWVPYDDNKAPIDNKVRITTNPDGTGVIETTTWKELAE